MTESRIEQFAEKLLAGYAWTTLPVDPLALARRERICLLPGHYDNCFDARIEYRTKHERGRFYLFYAEADETRPQSRVNFSVAHELGHFFLPQHCQYLRSGVWHGSHTEFLSVKRAEREADWFAAALLMPRRPFIECVQRTHAGLYTLGELESLADNAFKTSLTATAIRYAQLNFQACCVVLSDNEKVIFNFRSDEMKRLGFWWIHYVPAASLTGQLRAVQEKDGPMEAKGFVTADLWFEGAPKLPLWEEVKVGDNGKMLTLLAIPENDARAAEFAAGMHEYSV